MDEVGARLDAMAVGDRPIHVPERANVWLHEEMAFLARLVNLDVPRHYALNFNDVDVDAWLFTKATELDSCMTPERELGCSALTLAATTAVMKERGPSEEARDALIRFFHMLNVGVEKHEGTANAYCRVLLGIMELLSRQCAHAAWCYTL